MQPTEIVRATPWLQCYLSISQQCVHSFQEARIQHVGLIHNEGNLLIFATWATQHRTQVFIKVLASVFSMYLKSHTCVNKQILMYITEYK